MFARDLESFANCRVIVGISTQRFTENDPRGICEKNITSIDPACERFLKIQDYVY